eukprot:ANDGO_05279.mRNA.1 Superoxide-generating NADPH oxidase heavy chain subunit A
MGFFAAWKRRLTDKDEFANYWATEGHKVIFITLYVIVTIILFVEAAVRWAGLLEDVEKTNGKKYSWVIVARGFGQLLNFNCMLVIVPVLRSIITWMRKTRLANFLPLDKNIVFHRYIAYVIVFCGWAHGSAHYYNYNCCPEVYFKPNDFSKTSLEAAWSTLAGVTGNMLYLVILVMFSAAHSEYRKSRNFTVFWFVHHLFIVFFALVLAHGPNFWKWFVGPGALYFFERLARIFRGSRTVGVLRVHHLPSQVLFLELENKIQYKAGQYCFLNCPYLSKYEWHPFTISSAPEEEHLDFHIRCVGDWTQALSKLLNPDRKKDLVMNNYVGADGKYPLIKVDGPFGAPAEHIFEFEHIMLIAAGIGVTPYASILKHIHFRLQQNNVGKMKKVYFYWVNRDEGSWEWFSEILKNLEGKVRKDFLEVHTFFTGALKVDDIRTIVFSSAEVAAKGTDMPVSAYARAMYGYSAQASDEIDLQEDDDVEVLARNADGWWEGTNKRTGQKGLFPYNFVQVIDRITKMEEGSHRHYGRPHWDDIFKTVGQQVEAVTPPREAERPKVGVFFCGPAVMSKQLYQFSARANQLGRTAFDYKKENF